MGMLGSYCATEGSIMLYFKWETRWKRSHAKTVLHQQLMEENVFAKYFPGANFQVTPDGLVLKDHQNAKKV